MKSIKVNVFLSLPFEKRSPLVYGSVHTIPVSAIRFDIGYYYTESVQCQYTVNIAYNTNWLYKILINDNYKDNLCNYINDNFTWYSNLVVQS